MPDGGKANTFCDYNIPFKLRKSTRERDGRTLLSMKIKARATEGRWITSSHRRHHNMKLYFSCFRPLRLANRNKKLENCPFGPSLSLHPVKKGTGINEQKVPGSNPASNQATKKIFFQSLGGQQISRNILVRDQGTGGLLPRRGHETQGEAFCGDFRPDNPSHAIYMWRKGHEYLQR